MYYYFASSLLGGMQLQSHARTHTHSHTINNDNSDNNINNNKPTNISEHMSVKSYY